MNVEVPNSAISANEQIRRLEKINRALMDRVEKSMDFSGGAFSLFQTAILLDDKVRARTSDLERALEDLSDAYARLRDTRDEAETAKLNLTAAIEAVSEGFALFDSDERLVMCNTPFRELMPDVGDGLQPSRPFEEIARLFAGSKHLVLDKNQTAEDWWSKRIEIFREPYASFTQPFSDDRWVFVSNRKMSSGATVIFQTDITGTVRSERVRHERALDEQSQLLQATIDHMPQGISMFSADMRLRAWNRRFVELLVLPPQLVSQRLTLNRLFSVLRGQNYSQSDQDAQHVRNWLSGHHTESLTRVEFARFDGVLLRVESKSMPDGGLVLTFTDVTFEHKSTQALKIANETLEQRVEDRTAELKREIEERRLIEKQLLAAKEQAEEANKGKSRYLAAASHDLLQPLNASRIFLSLLLESGLPARQARLAESADKAFGSVEQLLEALLDISRFESRNVETNVGPFELRKLFDVLQSEFQPIADRKNLSLRFRCQGIWVRSDQALLRRVIQNLLSNALRYTESGGVLVVARRKQKDVAIEVYDTGPGIDKDKQQLVFEEFRRLAPSNNGEIKGMGLGLAIVDRIARLLGHEIKLSSVPGKGSRFSVWLEGAVPGLNPSARQGADGQARSRLSPCCAVVIENDLQILAGMVELLETRNIKAIPAVNADEALEALDTMESIPDIVIADYHLDEGTGLDAILALRRKCGSQMPAIIVTANHTATLKSDLASHGVTLLWKPIKPQLLFQTMDSALAWDTARPGRPEKRGQIRLL
jgi:hypothetical protein